MTPTHSSATGRWYYVVTILSMGLLSSVPIFHAASVLHRRHLWKLGAAYAGVTLVVFLVFGNAPTDETGTPTGLWADLAGFAIIGLIVAACLQHRQLRREVYGSPHSRARSQPQASDHPQVASVKEARQRRMKARELAANDPLMARELRIGRPDLQHEYDDGGLVDLNSAPTKVIADACQVSLQTAAAITTARASIGEFSSVEEALVYAHISGGSAEVIKDRALVLLASGR